MKKCTECKCVKPLNEFYRQSKAKNGLRPSCKSCHDARTYRYNDKNKDRIAAKRKLCYQGTGPYSNRARQEYVAWARSFKNSACTDCGQTFHVAAMQWDHLPEYKKEHNMASVMPKAVFLKEMAKCELVCANCHAVRTYERLK